LHDIARDRCMTIPVGMSIQTISGNYPRLFSSTVFESQSDISAHLAQKKGFTELIVLQKNGSKKLFFSPLGKYNRSRDTGDSYLHFHAGLGICHIHNVAAHLYDPITPLGNRLDLDVHNLAFLKIL
jgi:hypothetical protein